MSRPANLKNDAALLFTVLVWGLNFPVLKAAIAVMHPHAMNVFRLSVSVVVLGVLYVVEQRRAGTSLLAPLRAHGWKLFGMGLLGFFFYQYCFIVGVAHTTAGSAALIMASSPLWTAVIGHFFRLDFLTRLAWIGLGITLLGAVVIVVGGTKTIDIGDTTFLGNLLMMVAAMFWGAYTAFNKPLSRQTSPVSISFLGLFFALPFLYALGFPYVKTIPWSQVDAWIWVAILFSGGLSTGIAVALWNTAIKNVGPTHTAVFGNLVPVIALLSGFFLLGEAITSTQIGGGVLILGGLLVMRRSRAPSSKMLLD